MTAWLSWHHLGASCTRHSVLSFVCNSNRARKHITYEMSVKLNDVSQGMYVFYPAAREKKREDVAQASDATEQFAIPYFRLPFRSDTLHNCDMIKRNESDVGDIDFEILAKKVFRLFCFILFLASTNSS